MCASHFSVNFFVVPAWEKSLFNWQQIIWRQFYWSTFPLPSINLQRLRKTWKIYDWLTKLVGMKTIPQNTQSSSCFVIDCILVWGVNPDIPLGLSLYQGYMCLPMGVMGKRVTVSFLAPILYLNTLRAETLRSALRVVPTASLADTSFSPNNDLELGDTSAKIQDDCETYCLFTNVITLRAKNQNTDLSRQKTFLLIFRSTRGKFGTFKWLAHKSHSKCWQTKVLQKTFNLQQLIASGFEKADDDFIDAFVKEMSENENTKKSTEY